MSLHRAAKPLQHVPSRAMSGYVIVYSIIASQGKAAFFELRWRVWRRFPGITRGLRAPVGVPVRGGRGRDGPRALRRGPRPRGSALARAAAGRRSRFLVAATCADAPHRGRAHTPPLPPSLGVVRLNSTTRPDLFVCDPQTKLYETSGNKT